MANPVLRFLGIGDDGEERRDPLRTTQGGPARELSGKVEATMKYNSGKAVIKKFEPNSGYTKVHAAVEKGDLVKLHALIGSNAPLEECAKITRIFTLFNPTYQRDADWWVSGTPLHFGAWLDRINACKMLLEAGVNPNAVDDFGNTALHYAAAAGHYDMCWTLLDHGSSPHAVAETQVEVHEKFGNRKSKNWTGLTPGQVASKKAVKRLIFEYSHRQIIQKRRKKILSKPLTARPSSTVIQSEEVKRLSANIREEEQKLAAAARMLHSPQQTRDRIKSHYLDETEDNKNLYRAPGMYINSPEPESEPNPESSCYVDEGAINAYDDETPPSESPRSENANASVDNSAYAYKSTPVEEILPKKQPVKLNKSTAALPTGHMPNKKLTEKSRLTKSDGHKNGYPQ